VLAVLILLAAVFGMFWSLTERIPGYLHVYTVVIVLMTLSTSANWISSKPRLLLPAVLLALPLARLLAPLRKRQQGSLCPIKWSTLPNLFVS
jgi:hypothetical protein